MELDSLGNPLGDGAEREARARCPRRKPPAGARLVRRRQQRRCEESRISAATLARPLGNGPSRLILALGITGAALLACIVVSLAAAWALSELFGSERSLNHKPRRAPLFYGLYAALIAGGAALVLTSSSLIRLTVQIEILNALLLPLALGLLVLLAFRALPREHAPGRKRRLALGLTAGTVIAIALLRAGLALGL